MSKVLKDYRIISAEKRSQRESRIPKQWLLSKSYHEATNFMDVPTTCGLLSDVDCHITSSFDATALLEKIYVGEWSAEQVTVAFCKRAAIAHQLVRILQDKFKISLVQQLIFSSDELLNGDLLRRGYSTSSRP